MSRSSFAIRTGTRITVVLPEAHLRGKVVEERPIGLNLGSYAIGVNPVTGKISVLHKNCGSRPPRRLHFLTRSQAERVEHKGWLSKLRRSSATPWKIRVRQRLPHGR